MDLTLVLDRKESEKLARYYLYRSEEMEEAVKSWVASTYSDTWSAAPLQRP